MSVAWGTLDGVRPVKLVHYLKEQVSSNDRVIDILRNKYGLGEDSARLITDIAEQEIEILRPVTSNSNSIALYLNIPFCPSRCTYCSFISISNENAASLHGDYIKAILKEIRAVNRFIDAYSKKLSLIYIGGGTPTYLSKNYFAALLEEISRFNLQNLIEYTVEAGRADTISNDKLSIMSDYRVNRISINPQTMNADTLAKVNRQHTPKQVIETTKEAHKRNFLINMDIIVGLPGENSKDVWNTLKSILSLTPANITVHNLALKRTSAMNLQGDFDHKPCAESIHEMNAICREQLTRNNYFPYYLYRQKNTVGGHPNIGYALPGDECLYNMAMISEKCSIYGCGAGSVTKILDRKKRFKRLATPKNAYIYIKNIDEIIEKKIRWLENENLK